MLWVNGALLQEKDVYPWGLMRVLKRERGVVMGLVRAGLQGGAMAVDLLTHPNITATQTAKDVLEGLFDASDRLEGGSVIVWWNDIERDSRYAKWSPSLYSVRFFFLFFFNFKNKKTNGGADPTPAFPRSTT